MGNQVDVKAANDEWERKYKRHPFEWETRQLCQELARITIREEVIKRRLAYLRRRLQEMP